MTRELYIAQGKFALVDDADYGFLSQYRWGLQAAYAPGEFYAIRKGDGIPLHRLIMTVRPERVVDHINGNGLDNRRSNLRVCMPCENARNSRCVNKHGFKGVYRIVNRFRAAIRLEGVMAELGRYDTAEEAARAYDKAAVAAHGDFARLNFPHDYPGGHYGARQDEAA